MDDYRDVPPVRIAEAFREFAEKQCKDASPFYANLSLQAADAPEIMTLASFAKRGQPIQNILLAAVHYLLMQDVYHPLAAYYPSLNRSPQSGNPFPLFREYCSEHRDAIRQLIISRRVQTNEVGRCACLLPAFHVISRSYGDKPLTLIEVGSSAGLNLQWDRYYYSYSNGQECGERLSPVKLECNNIGERSLPVPKQFPQVIFRVGVDLAPVDIQDEDAVLWLWALVWPDQLQRLKQLANAIAVGRQHPPRIVTGNALDALPELMESVPSEATLCVYHSFALNQFSSESRAQFYQLLADHSRQRVVCCLGIEWMETPTSELHLSTFANGSRTDTPLAYCEAHGRWMGWRAANRVL